MNTKLLVDFFIKKKKTNIYGKKNIYEDQEEIPKLLSQSQFTIIYIIRCFPVIQKLLM